MPLILPSGFIVVEGALWWPLSVLSAERRGVEIPHDAPKLCAAVLDSGRWLGGVGVIEHGPLLMFEWFVLNDEAPLAKRHKAAERLMIAGKIYAQDVDKRPVMVVDRRRGGVGLRKMAERLGFASRNEYLEVLEG